MRKLFSLIVIAAASIGFCEGLSVRVDGPGMMRFVRNGRVVYAKSATLSVVDGKICQEDGLSLMPSVPSPQSPLTVAEDGTIQSGGAVVGKIVLALFQAEPSDDGLVSVSERPKLAVPGSDGAGTIQTGEPEVKVYPKEDAAAPPKVSESVPPPDEKFLKAGGVKIVIQDRSEVEGSTFTLGEVAAIFANAELAEKLAGIELGTTPPFGVERVVERSRIASRLKLAGIDNTEKFEVVGSVRAVVTRSGQKVTDDSIAQAAINAAVAKAGPQAQFEAATPGVDMVVPFGTVELSTETCQVAYGGATVTVGVYVDGKRFNSRTLRLKSTSPAASLRPGATVTVRVVAGGAVVETKGKVTTVSAQTGEVTVKVDGTDAVVTGTLAKDGAVEVKA